MSKGICFKEQLFYATIEGRKIQTRRMAKYKRKPLPLNYSVISLSNGRFEIYDENGRFVSKIKPRYQVGEKVYLKEPYARSYIHGIGDKYDNPLLAAGDPKCWETIYKFDDKIYTDDNGQVEWENKLFMPEKFARYFIEITGVRCERLQEISDEDCMKEGVRLVDTYGWSKSYSAGKNTTGKTPRESYAALIDKINGKCTWDSNPWVWVYDYRFLNNQ